MTTTVTPRTTAAGSTTQPSPPPLSVSEIKARIAAMTAEQIELINVTMLHQCIMPSLGPTGKANVAQAVAKAQSDEGVPMDAPTYINMPQTQQAVAKERFPFFLRHK